MKYLSRLIIGSLAFFLVASGPALAQGYGPARTSSAAVAGTTTGAGTAFSAAGSTAALIDVYSASTSSGTVKIEFSIDGTNYFPATTAVITDPTSAGEMWACAAAPYMRTNITAHASGTITGKLSFRTMPSDPIVGCKKIDTFGGYTFATGTGAFNVSTGKTAAITGSLTFAGTDATTMTFPTTSASVARTDAANTFTGVQTFSSPIAGALSTTIAAKLTDGAIASAPGIIAITKGSALGSSTLATPTTTGHDGYVLTIVSTTAYAHVVSVASGKVNGGSFTTITFTSGAIGDSVTLVAYQGVWYAVSKTGTITIS